MKYDLQKPIDKKQAETRFKKLLEKGSKIEIKEFRPKRTLDQNAYFHVACGLLSEYSGYTIDEIKIIIKDQLDWMTYMKNGHRFYRSTADLNTVEFTKLVDFTRSFGDDHGCYIPTPQEWLEHQFELAKAAM